MKLPKSFWAAFFLVLVVAFTVLALFAPLARAATQWPSTCAAAGTSINNATGSAMRSGWDANGAWRGWWCLKTRYEWAADPVVHVQLASVKWLDNANSQINAILAAGDPQAAFLTALRVFDVPPTAEQLPAYNALKGSGEADMRANKPRDPPWFVSGVTLLRKAYEVNPDGTLGKATVTQALVGAPCMCKQWALDANASAWCPWMGSPAGAVTLCSPGK